MALALVAAQSVDFGALAMRVRLLDSDTHASVFGVASLLAQAAAALLAAAYSRASPRRNLWLTVAMLVGALLALRVSAGFEGELLALPVGLVFVLLWRLSAPEHPRARAVMRAGLVLLTFSFVVHLVGPKVVSWSGYSENSWPYQVKGMLKHTTELAGWMLVATGVLAAGVSAAKSARV
jgi:hypothetical protein